ncbi:hypothetical protein GVI59_15205 [Acetobacter sicerae]|nr:hypothetical protein [Acetobacter sicerae]
MKVRRTATGADFSSSEGSALLRRNRCPVHRTERQDIALCLKSVSQDAIKSSSLFHMASTCSGAVQLPDCAPAILR